METIGFLNEPWSLISLSPFSYTMGVYEKSVL